MAKKAGNFPVETRRISLKKALAITPKQAAKIKQELTKAKPRKKRTPCVINKDAAECSPFQDGEVLTFPLEIKLQEFDTNETQLQRGFMCSGSTITQKEHVNHPLHYGGEHNPYEAIKVIEAWDLNFNLGNTVKYISRAGKKDDILKDLEKAAWYLNREIEKLKQ
jgi:hypothetical protein